MGNRVRLLMMVAVALCGCGGNERGDADAIREAYDGYQQAMTAGDGAAAGALVSSETLEYFAEIASLVRNGKRQDLERRPLIDRALVLSQRLFLPTEELAAMTADRAFEQFVSSSNGLLAAPDSGEATSRYVARITVDDRRAQADEVVNGELSTAKLAFVKEEGQWKLDLRASLVVAEEQIRLLRKLQAPDLDENEFLIMVLEQQATHTVPTSIWDPPSP